MIGVAMGEPLPSELRRDAIGMAVSTRGGEVAGVLFPRDRVPRDRVPRDRVPRDRVPRDRVPRDRGSPYLSDDFRGDCTKLGIVQSVGRIGSCHGNSPAESFRASLERELASRFRFETRAQARHAITAWIRHDNATRSHSSLRNLPPIEWELGYRPGTLQVA